MHPAYLVRGAPLGDDDVAGLLDDGDAVRVEQLPVSLPALPELELEAALAVEDLRQIEGEDSSVSLQHRICLISCRVSLFNAGHLLEMVFFYTHI